jgi:hypothetical protein
MNSARFGAMAVVLGNGKVLVAGGRNANANTYLQSAELYDPTAGVFSLTFGMNEQRTYSAAVLLSDGNVLVAGGENYVGGAAKRLNTATIYNVVGGYWTSVSNSMNMARKEAMVVSLSDGRVLIIGGRDSGTVGLASTEIFDPATMTFTSSTPTMDSARFSSGVVKLSDGSVLVVGGYTAATYYDSVLLFDPVSNAFFHLAPTLTTVLYNVQAILLTDGRVLISGGEFKTAFLYTP